MKLFRKTAFANITWGEVILIIGGALIAAILTFPLVHFRGSEWDTLLYLNTAQSTGPTAAILNRYTHIYLQKLFLALFTPLDAAKALWSFQIFTTGSLVYFSSKLLNLKNTFLTGVFALLFFFAQRDLFMRGGVPLVDFTTMLFVMASIFVYLIYLHTKRKPAGLLLLLGLIQFIILKSKETGIIILPLLIGTIWFSTADQRGRARNALMVLAGGLLGVILFIGLDGLLVGDALFSLRPENWRALLNFNLTLVYEQRSAQSWYDLIFTSALMLPFLFSVFVLNEDEKGKYTWAQRLIWLVPLVHVLILSAMIFRASFPLNFRYLYPSFPVIAILGAQYLFWPTKKELDQAIWVFLASLVVSLLLIVLVYPFVASLTLRWTEDNFFTSVLSSILISGIFLILLVRKPPILSRNVLLVPLVVILLSTPVLKAPRYMAAAREASQFGFSPFEIYADDIDLRDGLRLFFSSQPFSEFDILGRNSGSCEYMFEAYFDISVARVDYSESIEDLLLADYDYAFVTRAEFLSSTLDDDLNQRGFQIIDDPRSEVILIALTAQ